MFDYNEAKKLVLGQLTSEQTPSFDVIEKKVRSVRLMANIEYP